MSPKNDLLYIANEGSKLAKEDLGKKKFQKLVYLIETVGEVPLGYKYEIYLYGPYSRSLDDDLAALVNDGHIKYLHKDRSYIIRPTSDTYEAIEQTACSNKELIDSILQRFACKSPRDLELLTTAHFVAGLLDTRRTPDAIVNGVQKLKGPKFSVPQIQEAVRELSLA